MKANSTLKKQLIETLKEAYIVVHGKLPKKFEEADEFQPGQIGILFIVFIAYMLGVGLLWLGIHFGGFHGNSNHDWLLKAGADIAAITGLALLVMSTVCYFRNKACCTKNYYDLLDGLVVIKNKIATVFRHKSRWTMGYSAYTEGLEEIVELLLKGFQPNIEFAICRKDIGDKMYLLREICERQLKRLGGKIAVRKRLIPHEDRLHKVGAFADQISQLKELVLTAHSMFGLINETDPKYYESNPILLDEDFTELGIDKIALPMIQYIKAVMISGQPEWII